MRGQGLLGCVLLIAMLAGCAGDTESVADACLDAADAEACATDIVCEDALAAAGNVTAGASGNATDANATADAGLPADCPPVATNVTAEPPQPLLSMSAADGTPLNGTAILEGESITFSAAGSSAEGGLQAVALTVDEPNGTTTATLFEAGEFRDVTLTFPRAGIVNVTLRALDDAGQGASISAVAYVDRPSSGSEDGKLYAPSSSGCAATVSADDQARLLGNMFVHRQTFQVGSDVKWFSVEASNVQSVAICDPEGNRIDTGYSGGYAATDMDQWERSTQYYVALHPSGPAANMEWTITVHYGPQPE